MEIQKRENKIRMKRKVLLNVITIILLIAIAASSLVALFMLPNKVFFSILLAISVLGLIVYYLFSDNIQTFQKEGRKKFDIIITEELDRFFTDKKPYLNPTYKISDLEKQLGVSRSAITSLKMKKNESKLNIKKYEDEKINDLDVKKKPEIKMRV